MGFLAQLGVVVLTQSVARKPFHDKCNIKKPTKNKAFSLNLATFGLARRRRNLRLQSITFLPCIGFRRTRTQSAAADGTQ
jgi:hypothetical protein